MSLKTKQFKIIKHKIFSLNISKIPTKKFSVWKKKKKLIQKIKLYLKQMTKKNKIDGKIY